MADPAFEKEILAQIDPLYFFDYAMFTGSIRKYVSLTLELAYKQDPNPLHRKFHSVIVFKEEFSAYEDAGAFLKSFLDFRSNKTNLPIESLLSYKAKDVVLKALFSEYGIISAEDLYNNLKLDEWVPTEWSDWFPHLDLHKTLHLSCHFLFNDCLTKQPEKGVVAYNKLKHGPIVVPSSQHYVSAKPENPAVIFHTNKRDPNEQEVPFTLYPLLNSDETIEDRYRVIEFIQCNLRLFAALYVIWRYPDTVASRGFVGPKELFDRPEFVDIRHFIGEITAKK